MKSPSDYGSFDDLFYLYIYNFRSNSPKDFILLAAGFNLRRKKILSLLFVLIRLERLQIYIQIIVARQFKSLPKSVAAFFNAVFGDIQQQSGVFSPNPEAYKRSHAQLGRR